MKVFISWSGEKSQKIAIALHDWLQKVIQSIKPFVSKEDIEKGDVWFSSIERELIDSDFGLVCVTQENKNNPWLLFEAGALANKVGKAHMSPFLTDMTSGELERPLSLYQTTIFKSDDVLKMLRTINNISEQHLEDRNLEDCFSMWWPKLEENINKILKEDADKESPAQNKKKKTDDILEEHGRMLQDIKTFLITYQAQSVRRPSRAMMIGRDYLGKLSFLNNQLQEEIDEIRQITNPNFRAYARLDNLLELAKRERETIDELGRFLQDAIYPPMR